MASISLTLKSIYGIQSLHPMFDVFYLRVNGENKFVRIYHQDELFGFIEPLSFDTLADALDAYNWSPIDTGNTLIFAGSKPDVSIQ